MWVTWGAEVLPSPEVAFSPLQLRFVFHPPLYLYFVGVPFALFGSLEAVKYAQCFVGALLVPALGLIGRRAFGDRAALVAAAIAAFYPELVWFASHFWAETVFTVLLWWAIERLLAADARGSTGAALASGLLWGLAILTRETVLYFLPVAALWLAWRRTGGARRAAAAPRRSPCSSSLPWTLRNFLVFDAFVPVSTAGALNLWQGNTRLSRQEVYEEYWAVHGSIAEVRARPRAARSRRSSSASPCGSSRSCATSCRRSGRRTASPSSTSSAGPTARSPGARAYAAVLVVAAAVPRGARALRGGHA